MHLVLGSTDINNIKEEKLIHSSFFMINYREYRNELASKFNKLTDMEIE